MARQCPKPKRKRDATWFRDKVLLVEAQGSGKVLNEEELAFLADPGVAEGPITQMVITYNAAYQANDLDAYDSDYDDFSIAKTVLMANLSSYGSDVLSEEKKTKNIDKEIALENKVKELDNIVYKMGQSAQTGHMLTKPQVFYDNNLKQALGFHNPLYLKKAQQIRPMLYDGSVIAKETNVISIADSEETLMLEEESRSKMLLKQSDPIVLEKKVNIKPINYAKLNRLSEDFVKLQAKDITIKKLKANIKCLNKTSTTNNVKKDINEIETINIELEHRVAKLIAKNKHLKETYKQLYDSIKPSCVRTKEHAESLVNQLNQKSVEITDLNAQLQEKVFVITTVKNDLRKLNAQVSNATTIAPGMEIVEQDKSLNPLDSASYSTCKYVKLIQEFLGYVRDTCPNIHKPSEKLVAVTPINKKKTISSMFDARHEMCFHEFVFDMNASSKSKSVKKAKKKEEWKPTRKVFTKIRYNWRPTGRTFTLVGNACPLTRITATNKVPLREHIPLEVVAQEYVVTKVYTRRPKKFIDTIKFDNDQIAKIIGYGDYQIGNVIISRLYYMEGLGHNLFSVGQFCDSDLEVAFRKHTCFVRNLEGVDLLSGSRETNFYTLSIRDMMASSPVCLLSKESKTKSWLWHRRLSHLNFGAINHLDKNGLVRGLPILKFEKVHLCSVCAMGKSKKQSHKPKSEDTNQEKLYLLHMDLGRPMRVASINRKKYILVIVDDYSRFTWVKFLASKDEAPDFIIKFLKMIQVRLNATVRNIRTDNGTKFVNQTLCSYYESVGISHETSFACTPQQNGVVERRNRTLVKDARTMLIYAKAHLFLWAEAVATACYTQNRSIIWRRHGKTPYELLHDKKPDLSYLYVFGTLCYPNNDSEDLGKLQAKADIGIFIGYAPKKKAYHIYNRRYPENFIENNPVDLMS
ncbi:retrovirus-related pol polyprotein from transposon TNT 1-94 [Tanacetum coccineum]